MLFYVWELSENCTINKNSYSYDHFVVKENSLETAHKAKMLIIPLSANLLVYPLQLLLARQYYYL